MSYQGGNYDDDEMSVSLLEDTGAPGGNQGVLSLSLWNTSEIC